MFVDVEAEMLSTFVASSGVQNIESWWEYLLLLLPAEPMTAMVRNISGTNIVCVLPINNNNLLFVRFRAVGCGQPGQRYVHLQTKHR